MEKSAGRFLLLFGLALVFFYPALTHPYLDIDELIWGEMAKTIVKGCAPYVCAVGEKMPLIYLTISGFFKLFGPNNYFPLHLLNILWIAGTAWLLTRLIDTKPRWLPGLFYLLLMALPGFSILSLTGESLMNPFLILSWGLFLKQVKDPRFGPSLIIGILVGMATLFRHQAGIQLAVYGIAIFFPEQQDEPSWGPYLKSKVKFLFGTFIGFCLTLGIMALILWQWGSWKDFYHWAIQYNFTYIQSGGRTPGSLEKGFLNAAVLFGSTIVFWLFALLGMGKNSKRRDIKFLSALLYLFFSLIAAILGFRFYPHYFIQSFPPLVFFAILGWEALQIKPWIRGLALTVSILGVLIQHFTIERFLNWDPTKDYAPLNQHVGAYIKEHTKPEDTLFIWGWGHGIYYYADRRKAVRLMHSDPLSGRISSEDPQKYNYKDAERTTSPEAWEIFSQDMEKNQPIYVVNTSPANIHEYGYFPMEDYPILKEYVAQHYRLETTIDGVEIYRRLELR
jgi:dolichyl-phosphate-mannose-protein mannosyltransferase